MIKRNIRSQVPLRTSLTYNGVIEVDGLGAVVEPSGQCSILQILIQSFPRQAKNINWSLFLNYDKYFNIQLNQLIFRQVAKYLEAKFNNVPHTPDTKLLRRNQAQTNIRCASAFYFEARL